MKKFCSECGHHLEPGGLFCEACGSASTTTTASSDVPAAAVPAAPILDGARQHISLWIMPVNAVVVFITATTGVLLDFVSPAVPALTWVAALALALWLVALTLHVKPRFIESMGRTGRWIARLTAPLRRKRRLVFSGVLIAAFSVFAVASQHAQADGGLIASKSKKVHSWQENLGLIQVQLAEINAGQRAGNVLLQQGNLNTGALVQGQGVQTQALGELRDAFMAPSQRLRMALVTGDMVTATKHFEDGGKVALSEVFAMGMMSPVASTFIKRNIGVVQRTPGDCLELLEAKNLATIGGKPTFLPGQISVLRTFCRETSTKELQVELQGIDRELADAPTDPGVQSCTAYYLKRQSFYRSKLDRLDRDEVEKCGFDRCDDEASLAIASTSGEHYKTRVDSLCLEKATNTDNVEKRRRAGAIRDALVILSK